MVCCVLVSSFGSVSVRGHEYAYPLFCVTNLLGDWERLPFSFSRALRVPGLHRPSFIVRCVHVCFSFFFFLCGVISSCASVGAGLWKKPQRGGTTCRTFPYLSPSLYFSSSLFHIHSPPFSLSLSFAFFFSTPTHTRTHTHTHLCMQHSNPFKHLCE